MNIRWIALYICLFINGLAQAQSFTFADTHPVNNPDSLERWLVANPSASGLLRLKNLITLERTYSWNYHDKVGRYLAEIDRLATSLPYAGAKAAYQYIKAYMVFNQNQGAATVQYANQALTAFQQQNDPSGVLHAYGLLVLTNSTMYGNRVTSSASLSQQYLRKMEQLLAKTDDVHDFLMIQLVTTRYQYGELEEGIEPIRKTATDALKRIEQNPACTYARYRFERINALSYNMSGDNAMSYKLNKRILQQLQPDQIWEIATMTYNVATDCYKLNRTDEGIALCEKSIAMHRATKPLNYAALGGPYTKYRELLQQKGDFVNANRLADSVQKFNGFVFSAENDKKMLELQSRYESERKQVEINALEKQQGQTIIILVVSAVILLLLGVLVYKLVYTNRQLKVLNRSREHFMGIIAHDMRKPLVSLRGLAGLISTLLKQKAYHDIQELALSIDSTGLQIEAMLDNLLKWALAQRESIPYNPQAVPLAQTLGEVVSLYQQLTHLQGTVLLLSGAEKLWVWADPNGLQLIVRNLIDNALKHVEADGQILIRCGVSGDRVLIEVRDDGRGMSAERLLFLQGVLSGRVAGHVGENGLGLGLLLVRDFTRRNQGTITIDSKKDEGTTFIVSLPRAQSTMVSVQAGSQQDLSKRQGNA